MSGYIFRVIVSLDILGNVLVGGKVGETLSGSAWRGEQDKKIMGTFFRPIIDFIMRPWGKDHCKLSAEADAIRKNV